MASDIGQGDSELATLDVSPADVTTAATLTVTAPDGTSTGYSATGGVLVAIAGTSPVEYSQRWTADTPVMYSAPGLWVLHWEVTGTGEGAEDLEVYVVASPVAGGPTWAPGRSRVAAYIPHRTVVRAAGSTIASTDAYAWTWDSTTTPPGVTVDRLIADGVAWISALITPMNVKSEPTAGVLSALWAAIFIERSWPDDDDSLQRANDMEKQLNTMLAQLTASNDLANANDGVEGGSYAVDVAYSFPAADCRWDSPNYW